MSRVYELLAPYFPLRCLAARRVWVDPGTAVGLSHGLALQLNLESHPQHSGPWRYSPKVLVWGARYGRTDGLADGEYIEIPPCGLVVSLRARKLDEAGRPLRFLLEFGALQDEAAAALREDAPNEVCAELCEEA